MLISAINVPIAQKKRKNIEKRNEREQKILRVQPGKVIDFHSTKSPINMNTRNRSDVMGKKK